LTVFNRILAEDQKRAVPRTRRKAMVYPEFSDTSIPASTPAMLNSPERDAA